MNESSKVYLDKYVNKLSSAILCKSYLIHNFCPVPWHACQLDSTVFVGMFNDLGRF